MAASRSDEELLRSFLDGNQTSFAELMTRHEDRIFSLAYRMTGDRADALDATQEAFIAAFRQARNFRFDSAFGTWLYRIAINACHDLLRKRKRWGGGDVEREDHPDAVVGSFDDAVVARLDVTRALAQLPDEYREAVVMYDIGGVSYDEIARATDTVIGTVKSRISRGRKRLAELLEHRDPSAESKGTI
ncbi:MAG TPA: sigma-70 family RNA polymerase sigma factor [Actinomycetota bacterium]|nr:sigma-70 family RNA polymerase sigma factor [Actinomycetota bacterium]